MAEAKMVVSRIKGDFVKENKITELQIQSVPDYGKFGKLECTVQCNDEAQTKGTWQLNAQSNNALIKKFGKQTEDWVAKKIPVLAHEYESGVGIDVDVSKLEGTL